MLANSKGSVWQGLGLCSACCLLAGERWHVLACFACDGYSLPQSLACNKRATKLQQVMHRAGLPAATSAVPPAVWKGMIRLVGGAADRVTMSVMRQCWYLLA